MKLRIQEWFWGIDHHNGNYEERIIAEISVICEAGVNLRFETGRRQFSIDKVTQCTIELSVYTLNCSAPKETWSIKAGGKQIYVPHSFDGGYKYHIDVSAS